MSQDKPVLDREMIEELRKRINGHYWPDDQKRYKLVDALCDLALSALDRQGWVSVEERLPEIGDRVLVSWCNAYGKRKVGERVRLIEYEEATTFYWSYWHSRDGLLTQKAVTHWMPLPPAPQNEPPQVSSRTQIPDEGQRPASGSPDEGKS